MTVRSLAAVKCRPLSLLLHSLIPRRLSPSGKPTPPPLSHCLTIVDDSLWISATPATTILSRRQSQHLDPQRHRVFDPKSRIEPGVEPHRSDVWQFISFAVLATSLIDICPIIAWLSSSRVGSLDSRYQKTHDVWIGHDGKARVD